MKLTKDSEIIKTLLWKRQMLLDQNPAHKNIRPVLIICGGAMRGVQGAGAVIAFHKLGLADCFDAVFGISTGAATASYFMAGYEQTLLGTSIYYEECLDGFVNFRRWPVVDVDVIEKTMRTGKKKLAVENILNHRSNLYAGVTDWHQARGHLINVKYAKPDMVSAIKASMAMTALYRKTVKVNNRSFTDGSTSLPFPVKHVLREFNPTDVLIIANCSERHALVTPSTRSQLIESLFMIGLPTNLKKLLIRRSLVVRENVDHLRSSSVRFGIMWGFDHITRLTRDYAILKDGVAESAKQTLATFGSPGLPFELL